MIIAFCMVSLFASCLNYTFNKNFCPNGDLFSMTDHFWALCL